MSIFQRTQHESSAEYRFFEDEGHGWLAVPENEVHELAIAVSSCSYMDRGSNATGRRFIYLEEDCDLSTFLRAREATGRPVTYYVITTEGDSFIRSLPRYK